MLHDAQAHWADAAHGWLQSTGSPHTRRTYRRALDDFARFTGQSPWIVSPADVARWAAGLRGRGLSVSTVQLYLAAVSSFYAHAVEADLHDANPAAHATRPRPPAHHETQALTPDQARSLLQAIPRHTVQGQRDYALFLFYLCTGRRSAEVRHLRWGDFSTDSGATWYTWGRRNGHDGHGQRRAECPPQAWDAILAYLGAAGRLATIQPPDYVFTALGNAATHLPNVSARDWRPGERPLSGRAANQLLKRYARQAGLDPQGLSVRTLRYTAALLRVEAGGDLLDVCAFLDHASPAVTARCLRRLVD